MDIIYQWVVFKTFYPGQAAVIAILLAFVPISCFAVPSSASRVIGSRRPRPTRTARLEERTMASPESQVRHQHRARGAPHRHVVSAHAHERGSHADVGHSHRAVADQLRLHDRPGVSEAARSGYHHQGRGAAQLRPRAGWARHRDADPRHRLSRAVHAGTAPFAGVDAGGRARPWREHLSGVADADYCACFFSSSESRRSPAWCFRSGRSNRGGAWSTG